MLNKFYYSAVVLISIHLGFQKKDIDEMSFIELMEFVEKSLELKNIKEQKEIVDSIMLISIIHSNTEGLNAILRELQYSLYGNSGLDFNPTAGCLC